MNLITHLLSENKKLRGFHNTLVNWHTQVSECHISSMITINILYNLLTSPTRSAPNIETALSPIDHLTKDLNIVIKASNQTLQYEWWEIVNPLQYARYFISKLIENNLSNERHKWSANNTKWDGDKGSPCLNPQVERKKPSGHHYGALVKNFTRRVPIGPNLKV